MITQQLKYYTWRLLNPIIPCAICKIPSSLPVCKHCQNELEVNSPPYCTYCAKPGSFICNDCNNNTPVFSHTYCCYTYATPLSKMLHHLKYRCDKTNILALGYLFNKTLSSIKSDTDFILPIPLSKERLSERGFNQAEELLKYYQIKSGRIPVKTNIVSKIIDTPHQVSLSREKRQNMQEIYKVEKKISGKNILLVDDVITTGSTANNLAITLKSAGAKRIELCTLMRTVPHKDTLSY